jgi:flagellar protein FlbT
MSLKIRLKPHDKVIIGGSVITNAGTVCELLIETNVPILRQKDIMTEDEADSPCKRIYFVIQLMYIDGDSMTRHHEAYWKIIKEILDAAPSMLPLIDQISEQILSNNYYKALKLAQKLIQYEQEVINRA